MTKPVPRNCDVALKEWDAVRTALCDGVQILLIRKGGIHESHKQFRFEHDAFWIYPSFEHQRTEQLKQQHAHRLRAGSDDEPFLGIDTVCTVHQVIRLDPPQRLRQLDSFHIYAPPLIEMRLAYKPQRPLYLVLIRAYFLAEPHQLEVSAAYGGCRSWVPLKQKLSAEGLTAALDDQAFMHQVNEIQSALESGD